MRCSAASPSFYDYDRTPLKPKLDYRDTTSEFWVRERISFDAAYGGERMAAVLFIPKHGKPPYQTVVMMGGSGNLYTHSDSAINELQLDYLVKGGRMVVWPIFKGMFDRNINLVTDSPQETSAYRDLMVMMVKDARRTVDYLATRVRRGHHAARVLRIQLRRSGVAPILATEPRFKAAMLAVAGPEDGARTRGSGPAELPPASTSAAAHAERPARLLLPGGDVAEALLREPGHAAGAQAVGGVSGGAHGAAHRGDARDRWRGWTGTSGRCRADLASRVIRTIARYAIAYRSPSVRADAASKCTVSPLWRNPSVDT